MTDSAVFHNTVGDTYRDAAGPLSIGSGGLPDPSGEPDGEWLMTSSGAAIWVPAAANLVPIADAGNYFASTDVEGALQELGAAGGGASFGTPAFALGTANTNGSIDEVIRRDAGLAIFDTTAPTTQAFGDAAAVGSAAVAARRDHKHAMPAAPTSVSGNAGTATALQTGRAIDGVTFDGTADITVIAPGTHAATSKTTPVDNDELALVDSAASNVLKKLLWSNLKATLKAYFDTLYASSSGSAPIGTPELIYRYTVTGSDKASIDTGVDTPDAGSNVWTGGDVLEIYIVARTDDAVNAALTFSMTVNNDGSSIYDSMRFQGANATASAANDLAAASWRDFIGHGSTGTTGNAGVTKVEIPGYADTTFNKQGLATSGITDATAASNFMRQMAIGYRSTSAITRIAITAAGATKFKVGTKILIYKRRSS